MSPSARFRVRPRNLMLIVLLVLGVGLVKAWALFGALVPLGPCGLGVLRYDDQKWTVVHAENLTEQSAPAHWQGRGVVTAVSADRLTFHDFSGASLTFVPGGANPTGCS